MLTSFRRLPLFARIAAVMLAIAATGGQYWQRQPPGRLGLATLAVVQTLCPAILPSSDRPSIADVARMLDRAAWRLILDRVSPALSSRCLEGEDPS